MILAGYIYRFTYHITRNVVDSTIYSNSNLTLTFLVFSSLACADNDDSGYSVMFQTVVLKEWRAQLARTLRDLARFDLSPG